MSATLHTSRFQLCWWIGTSTQFLTRLLFSSEWVSSGRRGLNKVQRLRFRFFLETLLDRLEELHIDAEIDLSFDSLLKVNKLSFTIRLRKSFQLKQILFQLRYSQLTRYHHLHLCNLLVVWKWSQILHQILPSLRTLFHCERLLPICSLNRLQNTEQSFLLIR